jgi:glycerophosphoryl diester phosphodiesterase
VHGDIPSVDVTHSNAWLERRVIGFAHQGGAGEGPAGTIDTMRLAIENGSAGLEFDLHVSRDGALVVHHDRQVAAGGRVVVIAASDLAELRAVKADLAVLGEVLAAFPGVPLTVEVKAPEAAAPAARVLADEPGDRSVIVTAFSKRTVAAMKREAPGLDTAPGWQTNLGFWLASRIWRSPRLATGHVALQVALRLDQVKFVRRIPLVRRLPIADRRLVSAAHRRGLAVHVWTVDEEAEMRAVLAVAADGAFTDRPSVLTRVLVDAGVRWIPPHLKSN